MAERRMFAKTIIDSDAFLEMPSSSQCLYFHLCMRADDDGFVNNPRKILRMVGSSEDDLKILIAKRFVLAFESGVIVIKHWRLHNYIRKDTYNETLYIEEKSLLTVKPDGAYTDHALLPPSTERQRLVDGSLTQDRIGKESIVKDSLDKDIEPAPPKEAKHKFGEFGHVRLKDSEASKLTEELGKETFDKCITRLDEYIQETGKSYKDHNLTIRRWVIDAVKQPSKPIKQSSRQITSAEYDPNRPKVDTNSPEYMEMVRRTILGSKSGG